IFVGSGGHRRLCPQGRRGSGGRIQVRACVAVRQSRLSAPSAARPQARLTLAQTAEMCKARQASSAGGHHAGETTCEECFISKILLYSFPICFKDQIILVRPPAKLSSTSLVLAMLPPHKIFFLV
uniref:Uncharacterized protein n=1 Tax=Sus scrofa TaxID=9823 RepID=A0A8D0WYA9_PIG